jgi:putative redox protein
MVTSFINTELYRITHSNGRHTFYADEPEAIGGKDTAPSPDELLEAALASCTLATLRMYTNHKGWNVGRIEIRVALERKEGQTSITRELQFENPLAEEQQARLIQVAKACPVSKTLAGSTQLDVTIQ